MTCFAILLGALLLQGSIVLQNDALRMVFSDQDGRILQVRHRGSGMAWLEGGGSEPFRLFSALALPKEPDWTRLFAPGIEPEITAGNLLDRPWIARDVAFDSFQATPRSSGQSGGSYDFTWRRKGFFILHMRVTLGSGNGDLSLEPWVENLDGSRILVALECPVLGPVAELSPSGLDDRLALPVSLGFELHDPLALLAAPPPKLPAGLRFFHPQGFLGMTLQALAWYREGVGGFFLETKDPRLALKIFDVHRSGSSGPCELSITHLQQDLEPGRDLDPSYPVVMGTLETGSWIEAAEAYRYWALDQRGLSAGRTPAKRASSPENSEALEKIGSATFELGSSYEGVPFDQAGWFSSLGNVLDRPILHILGWDWTKNAFTSKDNYGPWDTFFPSRFHPGNLAAISNGDRVAPYIWDQWLNWFRFASIPFAQDSFLWPPRKIGGYVYLDPNNSEWRDFHRNRAAELRRVLSSPIVYHDISINNLVPYCFSTRHGHKPGDSVEMMRRYRQLLAASKKGLGRGARLGAELASEAYLAVQDFALGEQAGPTGGLAAAPFVPWVRNGQAREIPFFQYVFHEIGPVIVDGWMRLSGDDISKRQIGEIFYFVLARQVLQYGGLPMLSYGPFIGGTGGPELFPGQAGPSYRLQYDPSNPYVAGVPAHTVDRAKLAFLNELAEARTGFARHFLQHGRMRKPLELPPLAELSFDFCGIGPGSKGTFPVSRVIQGAYSAGGSLGFVFMNLHATDPVALEVTIDPAPYGLSSPPYRLRVVTRKGVSKERVLKAAATISLDLEPRKVILVEIR